MTTITLNGQTYSLVALPTSPGFADIEVGLNDSVAVLTSPFTRQEQVQQFPGGDFWDAMVTLPPMTRSQAAPWRGFLAELRGRLNVFQLSDPSAQPAPAGVGAPVVATSGAANLPMTWSLVTRGWTPNMFRVLLPGMQLQVGYRLYSVCEPVNVDSGGNATIVVGPSLRETPADGTAIILNKPAGLFRLKGNRRAIQASPERLTTFSIPCIEAR